LHEGSLLHHAKNPAGVLEICQNLAHVFTEYGPCCRPAGSNVGEYYQIL